MAKIDLILAGIYFFPRLNSQEILNLFVEFKEAANRQFDYDFNYLMEETETSVLNNDLSGFEKDGLDFTLISKKKALIDEQKIWVLWMHAFNDHESGTVFFIRPSTTKNRKKIIIETWIRMTEILQIFLTISKPDLIHMNGFTNSSDEESAFLPYPDHIDVKKLPNYFTPYTYVSKIRLPEKQIELINKLPAYRLKDMPNGLSIQFVEDLYSEPDSNTIDQLKIIMKKNEDVYRQINF